MTMSPYAHKFCRHVSDHSLMLRTARKATPHSGSTNCSR